MCHLFVFAFLLRFIKIYLISLIVISWFGETKCNQNQMTWFDETKCDQTQIFFASRKPTKNMIKEEIQPKTR